MLGYGHLQLLITVGAVAGIILIWLLALFPPLDYPQGHDRNEPGLPILSLNLIGVGIVTNHLPR
jgi:hypothetical protein